MLSRWTSTSSSRRFGSTTTGCGRSSTASRTPTSPSPPRASGPGATSSRTSNGGNATPATSSPPCARGATRTRRTSPSTSTPATRGSSRRAGAGPPPTSGPARPPPGRTSCARSRTPRTPTCSSPGDSRGRRASRSWRSSTATPIGTGRSTFRTCGRQAPTRAPGRRASRVRRPPGRPPGGDRRAGDQERVRAAHPVISRFAMLASSVFTPPSRNATVTSSSSRVSLEVTTTPSPKRAWTTRSPSRKSRSPGTRTRGAGAGRRGAGGPAARTARRARPAGELAHRQIVGKSASGWSGRLGAGTAQPRPGAARDPDGAPAAKASRRAARSREGRKLSPGAGAPGRPLPVRPGRRPPRAPRRDERRAPNARSRSYGSRRAREQSRALHQVGGDLEQEARRHGGRRRPGPRSRVATACERKSRSFARVIPT